MSETTPTPSVHDWFRARMAPQAFGLLDDAEEVRFLGHARECPDCDEAMKVFARDNREELRSAGHVPARMLARWDRARTRLRGLARRAVRAHLESCEACRQDLTLLGHTPALEVIPELESDDDAMAPRAVRLAEGTATRPAARPPRRWVPWALGGWATAATAAAIVLAVVPRGPTVVEGPTIPAAPLPSIAPTAEPTYTLDSGPPTLRLRTALRGGPDTGNSIVIRDEARVIQLLVGPFDLPEGQPLEAEVLRGDETLQRQTISRPGASGVGLLFGHERAPLAPGDYRLRLVSRPPVGASAMRPDTVEFSFRLVQRSR
jgi:hypothetical protein